VLATARSLRAQDLLVLLLSGGASAFMAAPAEGISLADKQQTVEMLLRDGADIEELNTVRKHLSAIKGGQLGSAARGPILTLALSDVPGDDLSVIGSGPTVPDATNADGALAIIARRGGIERFPRRVVTRLRRMAASEISDTPKPGDPRLKTSLARLIGGAVEALNGAQQAAEELGYRVCRVGERVSGEASAAALGYSALLARALLIESPPVCVLSSGETTVRVKGDGRGGRNQEFALALAPLLPRLGVRVAAASVGTDGIDGPTDAAGAVVDETTIARGAARGLSPPERYLEDNNSYEFFSALGDLIRTGPTNTNVADIQIALIARAP
jgi:hydroxypyruvate reductase